MSDNSFLIERSSCNRSSDSPKESFIPLHPPHDDIDGMVKKNIDGACEVLFRLQKIQSSYTIAFNHSNRSSPSRSSNTPSKIVRDGQLPNIFPHTSKNEDHNDEEDNEDKIDDDDDDSTSMEQQSTSTDPIVPSTINNDHNLFHVRSSINNNKSLFLPRHPTTRISRSMAMASFVNGKLKEIKEKCRWLDGCSPILDESRPPVTLPSLSPPLSPRWEYSPSLTPLTETSRVISPLFTPLSSTPQVFSCGNSRINSPAQHDDTMNEFTCRDPPCIPALNLSSINQLDPSSSSSSFEHNGGNGSPISSPLLSSSVSHTRTSTPLPLDVTTLERRLTRSTLSHIPSNSSIPNKGDFLRSVRSRDLALLDSSMRPHTTPPLGFPFSSTFTSPRARGRSPYLTSLNISPATSTFHSCANSRATSPTSSTRRIMANTPDNSSDMLCALNSPAISP